MSAAREKDQADFDLEAFIDLFDEALTSDDPSVQKTLQHLMVICALARNHDGHNSRSGPLRRIFDDQNNIIRRLERLETGSGPFGKPDSGYPGGGSIPLGPYFPPTAVPGTRQWPSVGGGTPWPPQPRTYPPGTIWAQTNGTSTSAVAKQSSTSYAYDPSPTSDLIAERVEDLLKSNKYTGSSVGANDVKIT
jgi:hypothetical protein